jgi:GNAT superfamily N-acetyltransferase
VVAGSHSPIARRATPADLPELQRLHHLAREHVGAERGGAVLLGREVRPAPVEESLQADLAAPDGVVLLGCLGPEPVGLAIARLETLHDGSRLAQVGELFVESDARDVGVGAALMHELIRWATEQGCDGIGSVVLPGDRASKNFFESFGLVARAIAVHRDLRR